MSRDELNALSERVIGAAYQVSNVLGAGFMEKVYERALLHELATQGIKATGQQQIPVYYKQALVGEYVADIVVEGRSLVELKCCEGFASEHVAQGLNYLKATGLSLALLLNFQKPRVEIKRIVL